MSAQNNGFCFQLGNLENENVKLVPFDANTHAPTYFEATQPHPEIYQHTMFGPYETLHEFITTFLEPIQSSPSDICFALIDKRAPPSTIDPAGQLAGLMACTKASVEHRIIEIGRTVILPGFQRKNIPTNALGLFLAYFFASPAEGGLGLLRVQVSASLENIASVEGLKRVGFRQEGIHRWLHVIHDASRRKKIGNGIPMPEYGHRRAVGRDTVYLAICWDDWLDGGRERVEQLMGKVEKSPGVQSKL